MKKRLKRNSYSRPKTRAKKLAAAIVAESVNQRFTKADNAAFMLEVTSMVCSAFSELLIRCPVARWIVDGDEKHPDGL